MSSTERGTDTPPSVGARLKAAVTKKEALRRALASAAAASIGCAHPTVSGLVRVRVRFAKEFHYRVTNRGRGVTVTVWVHPAKMWDFAALIATAGQYAAEMIEQRTRAITIEPPTTPEEG